MNQKSITGIIVPVVTPVDNNECVDEKAFRGVIRHCLNGGVDGIFVGGSAGTGPLLVDREWKRAMEIAHDEVKNGKTLMGGVICTSTAIALERIKFLEQTGFENFVITPTYYLKIDKDAQFLKHFERCRQKTDMNMIVYNIPSCTNSEIPFSVISHMAKNNWFKVIKESSGSRDYFTNIMDLANEFKFNVLQGSEANASWGLELGASGLVPVCANYEPQTFVEIWQAAVKGNFEKVKKLQTRINELCENLLGKPGYWISGLMYATSILGFGSGKPVSPLCEISEDSKKALCSFSKMSVSEPV